MKNPLSVMTLRDDGGNEGRPPAQQQKALIPNTPKRPAILADCPCYFKSRFTAARQSGQRLENRQSFRDPPNMVHSLAPVKRSVRIAGHATSVSLEPAFWEALQEIALRRGLAVNTLLAAIDADRRGNLSSAVRVFVLDSCRRGELAEGR
jgi:predicted DNA-binding ribbon-helix-helix protein